MWLWTQAPPRFVPSGAAGIQKEVASVQEVAARKFAYKLTFKLLKAIFTDSIQDKRILLK
jgi:hypothetical protein